MADLVDTIRDKLQSAFSPVHLDIKDTSGGCGSAFEVVIVSEKFEGLALLKRHRLVNSTLAAELEKIHAFSQTTFTPTQWRERQSAN